MRFFFFVISFSFTTCYAFSQSQVSEFFKSTDGSYHIYLPNNWVKETPKQSSIVFTFRPSDGKQNEIPTAISLEILPVTAGYETADIHAITNKELEITKNQYGNTFSILSHQYRNLNNKEWSQLIAEVKISKKKVFNFFILKAVHNAKTYALSFVGESDDYEKYFNIAFGVMQTFMFYTADKTVYFEDKNNVTPSLITKQLKNFSGVFTYKPNENYVNTITITTGDAPYKANEIRQITKEGQTFTYEAELKIEEITDKNIVLATDAVLKFDPGMQFRKAVYDLYRMDYGLSGQFKAKDSSFQQYGLDLWEEKSAIVNSQPLKEKNVVVQKPITSDKKSVVEKQSPSNTNSVSVINSPAKAQVVFKPKRANVDLAPIFSGSILRRWQVVGSKKGPYIKYKNKLVEFEFLSGGKFNAYENEIIRASGTYVLATDKKSVLMKDGGQSGPMKILKLAADQCIFLIDRDTMICYPANSASAKAALAKQALVEKSVRDWYNYYNAVKSVAREQQNILSSITNSPLAQSADLKKIGTESQIYGGEEAFYNMAFINSLFNKLDRIRSNTPILISRIESDSALIKEENIVSLLTVLKQVQTDCEEKEKGAVRFLNEYYN